MEAPEPSAARRKALRRYFQHVRDEIGLSVWQLDFGVNYPEDSQARMSIEGIPGKYEAIIRIGEGFWDLSRPETRECVVHELLHLFQIRLFHMIRDLSDHFPLAAHNVLLGEYKREMEYTNDRLTRAFENRLPLPPEWPK